MLAASPIYGQKKLLELDEVIAAVSTHLGSWVEIHYPNRLVQFWGSVRHAEPIRAFVGMGSVQGGSNERVLYGRVLHGRVLYG